MKRKQYVTPTAKVHVPRFVLLNPSLPVGSDPNDDPIEGKRGFFEDDDDGHSWGRVWGSMDD